VSVPAGPAGADAGSIVVIGIGNPMRRDDGVGHDVAEQVRSASLDGVRVVVLDGEATRLVDAWTGAGLAVVVDAVRSAAPPGTVHVVEVATGSDAGEPRAGGPEPGEGARGLPSSAAPASTHGSGLAEAVALGRTLGRMPHRLVLVGVEAVDVDDGPERTPGVLAAVPLAVDEVLVAIGSWSRS
jgi:hydrogenase maturation protease